MPTIYEVHDMPQGNSATRLFRSFLRSKGARRLVVITHALAVDLETLRLQVRDFLDAFASGSDQIH